MTLTETIHVIERVLPAAAALMSGSLVARRADVIWTPESRVLEKPFAWEPLVRGGRGQVGNARTEALAAISALKGDSPEMAPSGDTMPGSRLCLASHFYF
ncbi:MAG TPA: hypothetical protein VE621_14885 [Bryobacteraceae bacterium]|nr:hypothetical protein [Bryobacteraceae bacterium]